MKYIEKECLGCGLKELLPMLPNIRYVTYPFIHQDCKKADKERKEKENE